MAVGRIYEIRVKKKETLSQRAQEEVMKKLETKPDTFKYKGYAKITYASASPLTTIGVDPIEGTILDLFKEITDNVKV